MAKARYFDSKADVELMYLGVRPDYRNRGLGTGLVHAGCDAADNIGAKMFVHSSSMGIPVYRKCGFKAVEETGGNLTGTCLIRERQNGK